MALISQIIRDSLTELGVLNPIDEPSPQDLQYALRVFNRLVDNINANGLSVKWLEVKNYSEPSAGWSNIIVIGEGQDIDDTPPVRIEDLYFSDGTITYYLNRIPFHKWASISVKNTSAIPSEFTTQLIDNRYMELRFDYIPLSGLSLYIAGVYAWTDTDKRDFDLTDDIDFGYAFENYLVNRLAIDLSPSYGVKPSAITFEKARESLSLIRRLNFKPRILESNFKNNKYSIRDNPARY